MKLRYVALSIKSLVLGVAALAAVLVPIAGHTQALDAGVVLDWAEYRLPSLFRTPTPNLQRSVPSNLPLVYQGTGYTVRVYPRDRYLAISDAGDILGLGDFTGGQLMGFGTTQLLRNQILSDAQNQSVSVMLVSDVAAGEQFRFSLAGQSLAVSRKGEAVAFASGVRSGSAYTVAQLDGPRACSLSANRTGAMGFRDVVVTADCGRPPGQSALAGQVHAPVGSVLTLQVNGASEVTLTVPPFPGSADGYNLLPFSFAPSLADGATYQVSVKAAPAGQICTVYKGATGTMPVALGALRVGCEWRDDLLSRSSDNQVRGTYFESRDLVIGGAAGPVGGTSVGYGEGRFAAFVSSAVGLGGASGSHRQVFWRDRLTGETVLISASLSGVEGNGDSFAPAISADGLTVAFESSASNLVSGDSNGLRDVFVWSAQDRGAGLVRASVGLNGVQANGESYEPTLSGDGAMVAFSTSASNVVPGVSGTSTVNVVLRDLRAATNALVSADAAGRGVGGGRPMLSEDGMRLAFSAYSSQLVAGDTNGLWDIFVYEVPAGTLRRISFTATGAERNQGNESASRVVAPAISGNGRYVAFATTATNMGTGVTDGFQNIYVADTVTGRITRVSAAAIGTPNGDSPVGQGERVALSYDGAWVAFTTAATNLGVASGQIALRNWITGETRAIGVAAGGSAYVALSRDAGYVAFGHDAPVDRRFNGSGLFAEFTGLGRAWWWYE